MKILILGGDGLDLPTLCPSVTKTSGRARSETRTAVFPRRRNLSGSPHPCRLTMGFSEPGIGFFKIDKGLTDETAL